MTDYDGNNEDPTSKALNKALWRNVQLSGDVGALKAENGLLRQENARLRALVDGMTTEWAVRFEGEVYAVNSHSKHDAKAVAASSRSIVAVSRRVSPWVAAEGGV